MKRGNKSRKTKETPIFAQPTQPLPSTSKVKESRITLSPLKKKKKPASICVPVYALEAFITGILGVHTNTLKSLSKPHQNYHSVSLYANCHVCEEKEPSTFTLHPHHELPELRTVTSPGGSLTSRQGGCGPLELLESQTNATALKTALKC